MSTVQQFGSWLTKWFTLVVVMWAALNFFAPEASLWAKSYTGYFLSIVLFGMGMTLSLDDFRRIARMPLMVIVGTVAHYLIMPLLAVFLCWVFRLDGMVAVGVILVGCCPSGTSSNVMSFLSRGDVALDVSIGLLSTLLAPLMIPLLMSGLASQYVAIPVEQLFFTALKVVLIPVALGVTVHTVFGEKVAKVTTLMPAVSQVAILMIIGVVVAANNEKLFTAETAMILPVVILHNLGGYALGWGFSKAMFRVYPQGFQYAQQKAITFEVGMQDSALGATLALQAFAAHPVVAIPSTFFSVLHNISGSVLASWWRRRDDRHAIAADSANGEKGSAVGGATPVLVGAGASGSGAALAVDSGAPTASQGNGDVEPA